MRAKEQYRIESYDPETLVKFLMLHFDLRFDSDLAKILRLTPQQLHKIKHKQEDIAISDALLLRMHDATGIAVNDLRGMAGLPLVEQYKPFNKDQ